MKKNYLLLIMMCFTFIYINAQNDSIKSVKSNLIKEKKILDSKLKVINSQISDIDALIKVDKKWTIKGTNSLVFNQNTFSNWVSGGINSFGLNARMNYDFNYKNGKNIWENKVILGYGQVTNEGEKPRKTDDIISLSTTYGREIADKWFLSYNSSFLTQFSKGFDYASFPDAREGEQNSNFLAPAYLTIGIGFEYKPNDNFQAFIRPASTKMTFVQDEILQKKGLFGLENDGDSFRFELGASAGARHKGKITDNVSFDHSINFFTNYLDEPSHVDISYTGQLNMKINKYISSQFTIDLLYDHDQLRETQLKQTLGVGFAYNFEK